MKNILLVLMMSVGLVSAVDAQAMGRKVITVQRPIPLKEVAGGIYRINFVAEEPGVPTDSGDAFGCVVFAKKKVVSAGRYIVKSESSTRPTFGGNLFTHAWSDGAGLQITCGMPSHPATEARLNQLMRGYATIGR